MKKVVFLLLFFNFSFSQFGEPMIDVRLVNQSIGYPNSSSQSNDAGLNAILSSYGVNSYSFYMVHPYFPYQGKTMRIGGTFPTGLITALTNYSSVIAIARVSNDGSYTDTVELKLVDINVGVPIGESAGVVTTNDSGLNIIFQNYNVFYYSQAYPSLPIGNDLLKYFNVVCNCDKNLLKTALDNYATVVQTTQNIYGGVELSNNQFANTKATISPNPFFTNFTIKTEELISSYTLYDVTGKQLINTTSKEKLNDLSSQLHQGIYVLNISFENGQNANYKLVKE
jgi:Secretion system C-terminal sorting domain